MKVLFVFLAIAAVTTASWRIFLTDWKCMTDCRQQGYSWGYCKKLCSY